MSVEIKKIAEYLKLHQVDANNFDDVFFTKALDKRKENLNLNTYTDYYNYLESNNSEINFLNNSLYVNYSEFFRNNLSFAWLEQLIIPEIIRKKQQRKNKEIRIWSMATANGQEAYSIAMLLDEIISKSDKGVNYRIFATDINAQNIINAQAGIYTSEDIENISLKRLKTYFKKENNHYIVEENLRKNIYFSCFDVVSDKMLCPEASIFGDFDLIFCCNILFYYNINIQNIILEKAKNCISSNAYLITGEVEKEIVNKSGLFTEVYPTSIFRCK